MHGYPMLGTLSPRTENERLSSLFVSHDVLINLWFAP